MAECESPSQEDAPADASAACAGVINTDAMPQIVATA
jgi:hypothetical protein